MNLAVFPGASAGLNFPSQPPPLAGMRLSMSFPPWVRFEERQRRSVAKPKVAPQALPWVTRADDDNNPNGVVPSRR